MKTVETLIIGAGISGLTYAAYTNEDYLIVEKENEAGGLCRTIYEGDYVWDYAGHFFHFANQDLRNYFESAIRAEDMVKCVKKTNICYNDVVVDYPFQMNIHQLPKSEFIDCLYDLFHRKEKAKYDSFEDMLYCKFGQSITEKFLKPYNEKLYACDLNELDTDAMGRFFPYADPEQIIDNMKNSEVKTYNSTFDYPKKGAQYFINLLLKKIDQSKLKLNSEVERLDIDNKTAVIDGEAYHYDKLITTMPLNHFVKMIPDKYADIVKGSLSCNKVLVFNLGFDRQLEDTETHWTYIPMKDINFYRVGYYSNILGADRLSMYVEIGLKEQEEFSQNEQLELTLKNLKKIGLISGHVLLAHRALLINPGYVHITSQSVEKVKNLRGALAKQNVYSIGRYGGWTYCSIEDCMVEAMNLAQRK